jgi:pre-mRNA-processing factor 8
VDEIPKVI